MKQPQIADLLTPVLGDLDLDLEAVDLIPAGKRKLLRVVVDGDGTNGRGPNLDDIAEATKAISAALDEADVTGTSPYTLEVSSRGVGRPLEQPRHWRRNVTRLVAVTTETGDKLTGRIVSARDDAAVLEVDGSPVVLAFAAVTRAEIQVELNRRSGHDGGPDDEEEGDVGPDDEAPDDGGPDDQGPDDEEEED